MSQAITPPMRAILIDASRGRLPRWEPRPRGPRLRQAHWSWWLHDKTCNAPAVNALIRRELLHRVETSLGDERRDAFPTEAGDAAARVLAGEGTVFCDTENFAPPNAIPAFAGKLFRHLCADDPQELHAYAAAIGLRRAWAQTSNQGILHYDVTGNALKILNEDIAAGIVEALDRAAFIVRANKTTQGATT